jgi:hypothetical protein
MWKIRAKRRTWKAPGVMKNKFKLNFVETGKRKTARSHRLLRNGIECKQKQKSCLFLGLWVENWWELNIKG